MKCQSSKCYQGRASFCGECTPEQRLECRKEAKEVKGVVVTDPVAFADDIKEGEELLPEDEMAKHGWVKRGSEKQEGNQNVR